MAEVEDEIVAAGAEIIWVLEQDVEGTPGTAALCMDTLDYFASEQGWCVGDDQTQPEAGTFDESPFSEGRGFDIIVPIRTMTIEYTTNHGTPSGNENPTGEEVLAAVEEIVAGLQ